MNSSCIATNKLIQMSNRTRQMRTRHGRWGPAKQNLRSTSIGNGVWSATNTHNTTPAASGFLYFLRPVSYFAAISILCVHVSNNNSVLPRTSLLRDASHWQSLTVRLLSDYITSSDSARSREFYNLGRAYFFLNLFFFFFFRRIRSLKSVDSNSLHFPNLP